MVKQRLSVIDGPPFLEENLDLYSHLKHVVQTYPNNIAVISRAQSPDLLSDRGSDRQGPGSQGTCLRWTYADLFSKAEHLAAILVARGFDKSKTLAVVFRNQAEFALCFWAALRIGCVFASLPPGTQNQEELRHKLKIISPGALIATDAETATGLENAAQDELQQIAIKLQATGPSINKQWSLLTEMFAMQSPSGALSEPRSKATDEIVTIFTSGTTSLPKGCPTISATWVVGGRNLGAAHHVVSSNKLCAISPTSSALGMLSLWPFWFAGACVVFPSATFNPLATLDALEQEGCTDMPAVPSVISSLTEHPTITGRRFQLKHVMLGGSIVHPDALRKCRDTSGLAAEYCTSGFGMSETGGTTFWNLDDKQPEYTDTVSVGKAMPGVRLRICEPDSTKPMPWGEVGELHIGGLSVIPNYKHKPEDPSCYFEDGSNWLVTGDQARFGQVDELYIMGRYKDLIIRGGVNISPASIESVLNREPGVQAFVVGAPDEIAGEVPVAVVKSAKNADLTYKELKNIAARALGPASAPKVIIDLKDLGMESFPLTSAAKVNKRYIAAQVREHLQKLAGSSHAESNGAAGPSTNGITNVHGTSTEDVVTGIWAQLSGQAPEEVARDQDVTEQGADSLMVLQFTSQVVKRLDKSIASNEVYANRTIQQQARLLDSRRSKKSKTSQGLPKRSGPPSVAEVVHLDGDRAAYERTKRVAEHALSDFGMSWEDVEDILPTYDNGRFMIENSCRVQSWNHRFVFISDVDPQGVRKALEQSLDRNIMFRSIAILDNDRYLNVAVRSSQRWYDQLITQETKVISEQAACSYRWDDPDWDFAAPPGPLTKATLVPLEGGSTATIVNINHSMYEAFSASMWLDDLAMILDGRLNQCPERVPYKIWNDAYELGRTNAEAMASNQFFVEHLQGIGALQGKLWPSTRAPDWIKGSPVGWRHRDGRPRDPAERHYTEPEDQRSGMNGLTATMILHQVDTLRSSQGISLIALFKTAVALFNARVTGTGEAVFSSWEAARMWPFVDNNKAISALLPNPADVAGPVGERIGNHIKVDRNGKMLDLLLGMQNEMTLLSRHAHAPLYTVAKMLSENTTKSDTPKEDAEVFMDSLQRQIFNWIPNLTPPGGESAKKLRRIQQVARGDCGIVWTGSRPKRDTLSVNVGWDDAQLTRDEVKDALAEVVNAMEWMMEPENLQKSVAEWWKHRESNGLSYEGIVVAASQYL